MVSAEEAIDDFQQRPQCQSARLIDFDTAEIHPGIIPRTFFLVVRGEKPYMNMQVSLDPLVYIVQPEYWGIEVVGRLPGFGLPALAPYTVARPLDGIAGSKGIEVIGANRTEKIEVSL